MSMIPAQLPSALINHLWQSTLFATTVWLLTVALRKNQAHIRYRLWLIASIKFLLPFSLLIDTGERLRTHLSNAITSKPLPVAVAQLTQPFAQMDFSYLKDPATDVPLAASHSSHFWPYLIAAIWLSGSAALLFTWLRRWSQLCRIARNATPLEIDAPFAVRTSKSTLEPGIFGIYNPVLLLPEGITERLSPAQLAAILAHEATHVRRRDNLTAALHMFVQALFWFHPMTWWIQARLIEERECACDEAVLAENNEAEVYAESILNVCKFYVESPLTCASGVTGSDLKKRIMRIMTNRSTRKLDLSRKLLLGCAAAIALAVPLSFGLLHPRDVQAQAAAADSIVGTWQGTLQPPDGPGLRSVLKIERVAGTLKSTLYSIDQGGMPIPANSTTMDGANLKYLIDRIEGKYEGKLSSDGKTITGTWTQGGRPIQLNFTKATPETAWNIPEPPKPIPPMPADAKPVFEVATIKPSDPARQGKGFRVNGRHFSTINTTLSNIITFAYGINAKQIVGAPDWITQEMFDIEAQPDIDGSPSHAQVQMMLQKLLADRFQLKFHEEQRELNAYVLEVGKGGPKLTKSDADPRGLPGLMFRGLGDFNGRNASMDEFAQLLQDAVMDRPVVNKTGLTDKYDFRLKWTPDESQFSGLGLKVQKPTESADAPPPLFTALQEQLGLKMDSTKTPVKVLIIDKLEKPSAN